MEEYEHSFKVKSIKPFIEFCKKHDYKQISACTQNRKVFVSSYDSHLISRLTVEKTNNKTQTFFDFKHTGVEIDGKNLSKESKSLTATEDLLPFVNSILEILNFKLVADNFRTRFVFSKDGLTFEIDDYTTPNMKVVAVEGDQDAVESLCENELKEVLDKNIVN